MENQEKNCDVCKEAIEIYAIGECDHPICLTCCTRMRILIGQDYCPICRGNVPKVIFLDDLKLFKDAESKSLIPYKQNGIFFQSRKVKEACLELLQHRCPVCPDRAPDTSFKALETHLKRDHTLFFCDLCVKHLNLFTHERKIYSRKDLATHRRIGDADEMCYKGHPLCRFCDERYMDNDELFRHLRHDHYFCHFCGEDEFYSDYNALKMHFSKDHYLCQEGECASSNTRFTHAFASEIDMKAHRSAEHMQALSKSQAREARTLDLEFNYANAPRRRERGFRPNREDGADSGRERGPRQRGDRFDRNRENWDQEEVSRAMEMSRRETQRGQQGRNSPSNFEGNSRNARGRNSPGLFEEKRSSPPPPPPVPVNSEHYPTLNGREPPAAGSPRLVQKTVEKTEENYPSLSRNPTTSAPPSRTTPAPPSLASRLGRPTAASEAAALRPSSGPTPAPAPSRPVPSAVTRQPEKATMAAAAVRKMPTEEDFPELGGRSSHVPAAALGAWGKGKGKGGSKPVVVQAPVRIDRVELGRGMGVHVPSKSAANLGRKLQDDSEFPSLGGGRSAVVVPPGTWVTKNSGNKNQSRNSKVAKPEKDWFDVRESFASDFTETVVKTETDNSFKLGKKSKKKNSQPQESSAANVKVNNETSSNCPVSDNRFSVLSSKEETSPPVVKHEDDNWSESSEGHASSCDSVPDSEDVPVVVREPEKPVKVVPPASFNLGEDFPSLGAGSRKDAYPGQPQSSKRKNKAKARAKVSEEPAQKVKQESKTETSNGPSKSLDGIASLLLGSVPAATQPKKAATEAPAGNLLPPSSCGEDDVSEDSGISSWDDIASRPPVLKAPPGLQLAQSTPALSQPSALASLPPGFGGLPWQKAFSFVQPIGFSQRNTGLVQKVKEVLDGDEFKFAQFKRLSMQFRQEQLRAWDYYSSCLELMGPRFPAVFPELIALLPDIGKQQELLKAHSASLKKAQNNVLPFSQHSKSKWSTAETISSCPACQQVLISPDVNYHMEQHDQSDFPSLQVTGSLIKTK